MESKIGHDVESRTYAFDDFSEGDVFESDLEITPTVLDDILRILDYRSSVMRDDEGAVSHGYASRPIPAAYAAAYQFIAAVPGVVLPPGGIYAKQDLKLQGSAYVGDTLHTTTTVESKYERRGRLYVTFLSQTNNQHGDPIVWGRRVRIWPK